MPRDMVLVLDTSGSMRGRQDGAGPQGPEILPGQPGRQGPLRPDQLRHHGQQVHGGSDATAARSRSSRPGSGSISWRRRRHGHQRRPGGGPGHAIHATPGRTFTIVFFTDGQPTIGETDPEKILKNVVGQEHGQHAHLHLRRRRRRQRHAAGPAGRADAGDQHLRAARRRTSRPRSAVCTARSAIRCWPT